MTFEIVNIEMETRKKGLRRIDAIAQDEEKTMVWISYFPFYNNLTVKDIGRVLNKSYDLMRRERVIPETPETLKIGLIVGGE